MTTTRRATAADLAFLLQVFPGSGTLTDGFPLEGDLGFIAVREGQDAGAIWSRLTESEVPELHLGVVDGRRGEGIGNALLHALIAAAPGDLRVTVEDGDPIEELYRKNGFEPAGRTGTATTMLRERPEFR
jgi:GNAT superfamily N-acetyltransferase